MSNVIKNNNNNNKKSAKGVSLFLLINAIKSEKRECPFVSIGGM